jgi:hypothetical protein
MLGKESGNLLWQEMQTVHLLDKESEKIHRVFCKDGENVCPVCQGKWKDKRCVMVV